MAEIRVRWHLAQLNALSGQLGRGARRQLIAESKQALDTHLAIADTEIVQNLSGRILKRRTGNLARSVLHRSRQQVALLIGEVGILKEGPTWKYAGIHLTGGIIRPKRAKYLAIPLPAALTAAGVPRYNSPLRETLKAAFPAGTFVAKGVLFGKLGKTPRGRLRQRGGANIVPLFALKKSVTIPQRDYMSAPKAKLTKNVSLDLIALMQRLVSAPR